MSPPNLTDQSDESCHFYSLNVFNPGNATCAAVFLDRDGVILEEKNYIKSPSQVEFIAGSVDAIKLLNRTRVFVGIVTNQAGVARGLMTHEQVREVNEALFKQLRERSLTVHCLMYCPYHPEGVIPAYTRQSSFRKPGTGMLDFIRKRYHLEAFKYFVVGDKASDVEAGLRFGATSILVQTGFGLEQSHLVKKDFPSVRIEPNLLQATVWITSQLTRTP